MDNCNEIVSAEQLIEGDGKRRILALFPKKSAQFSRTKTVIERRSKRKCVEMLGIAYDQRLPTGKNFLYS